MPKRPSNDEELDSGWVAMPRYEPTIYRKHFKMKNYWVIRVYQVRKAMELYNPVLTCAGVPIEPCPARLSLFLQGDWHGKKDAQKLIDEMRRYVRYE
jgi:hypothetical protein